MSESNLLSTTKDQFNKSVYMEFLISVQKVVFNLNEENLESTVQHTMELFDSNYPYSFNLIICNLVYFAFCSQKGNGDIFLNYLLLIKTKEEKMNITADIIKIFSNCISNANTQESYYLIEKLIDQNLIDSSITKNIHSLYFIHYKTKDEINGFFSFNSDHYHFLKDINELSNNNWELHKKYIREGVNRSEITEIIRNDEIGKLQEMASQKEFDFNQYIKPSLYERYTTTNTYVTLIDYAAFFGSSKIFKYLLLNGSKLDNTGIYAIAGGNMEIIHLCEQNHSSFFGAYETAIRFHRNDIFKYLYENKLVEQNINGSSKNDDSDSDPDSDDSDYYKTRFMKMFKSNINDLNFICISSGNFELLSFLENDKKKSEIISLIRQQFKGIYSLLNIILKNVKYHKIF